MQSTVEISETVRTNHEGETWSRRCQGILNGTLPPLTDEEIIEEADRRYEELRSGKTRGLTWEEYQLFNRLGDEFPFLSAEEILEEIDRRYEARKHREVENSTVQEYELAIK